MEEFAGSIPALGTMMTYGLDFDGTYTAAKDLWDVFIAAALQRGHRVILVTNREGTDEDKQVVLQWLGPGVSAFFANGLPKREVALEAGYQVDVWIDDYPILVDFGAVGVHALQGNELGKCLEHMEQVVGRSYRPDPTR